MLPVLVKLKLASAMLANVSATQAPVPLPVHVTVLAAGAAAESLAPVEVHLYDENMRVSADVEIERDGAVDDATATELTHLFKDRRTNREKPIAKQTLAMLADLGDRYRGKTIEFVSAYRTGNQESAGSPHRAGRAIDFRIRGMALGEIRDYLWRKYADVGIGWYPSEQFIHMDTRPVEHDMAWTFFAGTNHYHPYWAEAARRPVVVAPVRTHERRPGS
ncbi:MAG: DUF882 domain-containing protein [Proteobacteria bacterium]|nr:DUF882 domain-containing protein [Pseudomonadota bacterium]